ncbi:Membrane-associated guanylate kinase, WW and PDZ domain-containing protein 3 [Homalodisca vitripennis]|nr:Membrane-associated guanylate kinase, WW and PDZ domain-containing protein 3 [Homalodisca vitripennis]
MLKTGQKRPNTPNTTKGATEGEVGGSAVTEEHWQNSLQVVTITALEDGTLNFSIGGGSDSGEFAYITDVSLGKVNCISGVLNEYDILLEIQGQKVAGYTRRDTVAWLNHCCRSGNPVNLKTTAAVVSRSVLHEHLSGKRNNSLLLIFVKICQYEVYFRARLDDSSVSARCRVCSPWTKSL